jgi:hypothetical protein
MPVRPATGRVSARLALAVVACVATSCGSAHAPALRFQNHPPVWRVYDRAPIPKPEARPAEGFMSDVHALARLVPLDALALPARPLAFNINAAGGVPDSSWFENRIGARALSPFELARGPGGTEPDRSAPLRVLDVNRAAPSLRMNVEDARGDRYRLKFDFRTQPETETGAHIVVQRMLWAIGYFVPQDQLFEFRREALTAAEDGVEIVSVVKRRRLSERALDEALAAEPRMPDGVHYRVVASKLLPGEAVGGYAMRGVRPDDPNDRVPHQHRRDVRALRVFSSWLGSTDMKEDNTLDMWTPHPGQQDVGHLTHYLIDFGKALGAWAHQGEHEHDGFAAHFEYGYALGSLLSFGLWTRPWERVRDPRLRGVGRFDAASFRPDLFSPSMPYEPFLYTDRFDALWAAEIIARFRPAYIAAVIAEARYTDPRSRDYLVRTLVARQRKLLHYWYAQTTPLDRFQVEARADEVRICATDLLLDGGLADPAATRYAVDAYDFHGRPLPWRSLRRGGETVCTSALRPPAEHDGYAMLVYTVHRGDLELPAVAVHVARNPRTLEYRIVGVERH